MSYIGISVNNKTESELVQKILFKMGYEWNTGGTDVFHTQSIITKFLYMDIYDVSISCSEGYDDEDVYKLLDFEEFITQLENNTLL